MLVTVLLLALQSAYLFGDNTVFKPDPVGEKIYREHSLPQLIPLAIIIFALLVLAGVAAVHKIRRKADDPAHPCIEAQHR